MKENLFPRSVPPYCHIKSWITVFTVNTFIKHLAQPGLHFGPEISVAHPDLFHLSSNYFKYEILIFEKPLESGDSYLTINTRYENLA